VLAAFVLTAAAVGGWLVLLVQLLLFVPGFGLGLVFFVPPAMALGRWYVGWSRRLIQWCSGIAVPQEYRPRPEPLQPGPDGLYRHDRQLYRRAWAPTFSRWLEWALADRANWRDLRWLAVAPVAVVVLVVVPALSVVFADAGVRAYARFSRVVIGPGSPARQARADRRRIWVQVHGLALVRLGALFGMTVIGLFALALSLLCLLPPVGLVVVYFFPSILEGSRGLTNWRRHLAGRWSGVEVGEPYRPRPEPPVRREDGMYAVGKQLYRTVQMAGNELRMRWLLRDPATWRDLCFLLLDPIVGAAIALVPVAAVAYGLWGLALPGLWRVTFHAPLGGSYGTVAGSALLAVLVGCALAWTAALVAPAALGLHGRWTRVFLAPTAAAVLAQRVVALALSRADATDVQAAELRRIERDLHDGAQARLVAVGLSLDAIERLIDTDPQAARRLAAQAREAAGTALAELRALVRGIHPPVLAERGLADAVRALALDTPLPVTVTAQVPPRLPAPVESAAYFAVAEALTNAVRHAEARMVTVDIRHDGGVLRIVVADDGRGGAEPERGSGLRGMRRRLGMFDGELLVVSPVGGPTTLTIHLPSVLPAPRGPQ
jgi:signal transduction histidine kinase